MKLNEFIGIDHPSEKLHVARETIERMIVEKEIVDTDAFLYVYRSLQSSLPVIAAERALDRKFGFLPVWKEHPMFGINHPDEKDKWAREYQKNYSLLTKVFEILIERTV